MLVFIGFLLVFYLAYRFAKFIEPHMDEPGLYANWPIAFASLSGIVFGGLFIVTYLAGWY